MKTSPTPGFAVNKANFFLTTINFYHKYCNRLRNITFYKGPNKAFLVPDSCRAMVKNGNSISMNVTEHTIE